MGAGRVVTDTMARTRDGAGNRIVTDGSMRSRWPLFRWAPVATGLFAGSSAAAFALSCGGPLSDACDELGTCARTSADASVDGSVEASADTSAERACDPTKEPKADACVIDSAYGVFVVPAGGIDGGPEAGDNGLGAADGTSERPYTSIGRALAGKGSKARLYLCNGFYNEPVSITTAVSIYGGLSCATGASGRVWSYVGQGAKVAAPAGAYALSVTGVQDGTVTIADVSFEAPDATAPGTSSIAAFVASSTVLLERVALTAGNGANGAPGADGLANPNYTGLAPAGGGQLSPGPAGSGTFSINGGAGGLNRCTPFGTSAGGDGGLGCATDAGSPGLGSPGTATPPAPVTMVGRDGLPRGTVLPDAGGATTLSDDPGADGVPRDGGVAAAVQLYGTVSASGWAPSPGGDGAPGSPGQGGAGATDPLYGECGTSDQSIGGGGGGAGGCGGAGGKGGGGGGASVALASVASSVQLISCALTAGHGGTGGAGGSGQDGQAGGAGGDSSFPSAHAAGAPGGNGAGGSGGAGGTGGVSVGILESNATVMSDLATTQNTQLGAPGAGGAAGPAGRHGLGVAVTTGADGNAGASGSAGTAASVLELM